MMTPGLVVLADRWDKGWNAYLDGRPAPIRGPIMPFAAGGAGGQGDAGVPLRAGQLRLGTAVGRGGLAGDVGLVRRRPVDRVFADAVAAVVAIAVAATARVRADAGEGSAVAQVEEAPPRPEKLVSVGTRSPMNRRPRSMASPGHVVAELAGGEPRRDVRFSISRGGKLT